MSSLARLVAGIAHELNNPINFVYGNVDFLAQYVEDLLSLVEAIDAAELPPEARARLEKRKEEIEFDFLVGDVRRLLRSIRSGVERTAGIVRDLKNFSRDGGPAETPQEMDVVAGIETTLNLIGPLHKRRITIVREYGSDLPKIICHAGRINQVFMNLLTNAAQAIESEGTIRIRIETLDGGERIRVAVTDDGVGIPPDLRDRITDPFFTTKEVGEGTGLGLWISESIVRSHGGVLAWESAPGQGATFTVTLPVKTAGRAD
jgi:two-component system, NtrC family, sensor kinase